MPETKRLFSFQSQVLDQDAFEVVSFTGVEGLSKLYRFDITVCSPEPDIDLEAITQSRAVFTIKRDDGDIVFHGILVSFEQMHATNDLYFYRAVLTPAFWRQSLTSHNQVFLDMTVPLIIEAALKDVGFTTLDYEFRLTGQYPAREYVCQYRESHFSFISRWMEREGIYFFFEQGEEQEKLIITDNMLSHTVMAEGELMLYLPPSGLDEEAREESIKSFICRQTILPARVLLRDYNYRKPSLELVAEASVSARGIGDVYIYGEHFTTPEEGNQLAGIRAGELKSRARLYNGESMIPYLRPGYIFTLDRHYRKDFNINYLTTDVEHEGNQTFYLTSGMGVAEVGRELRPYYRNSFTVIPEQVQFRPARVTDKPRFSGCLNAHVDAEGSGQYAEIDDQGRYKVRLPFDLSGALGGKASSWIRMAQPYAGSDHGMHFPLHKGTEVLLTFIDGDPDRPIIASAVTNCNSPSPVTAANSTQSRITTAGQNKIHIEDATGNERILLHTPKENSWIRMGTPNDPPRVLLSPTLVYNPDEPPAGLTDDQKKEVNKLVDEKLEESDAESGIKLFSSSGFEVEAAFENSVILGEKLDVTVGSVTELLAGLEMSAKLASSCDFFYGNSLEVSGGTKLEHALYDIITFTENNDLMAAESLAIKAGGASPSYIPLVKGMTTLSLLSTAAGLVGAELGKDIKEVKLGMAAASVAIAAIGALLSSKAFKTLAKTPVNYSCAITMNEAVVPPTVPPTFNETIEISAPKIEINANKDTLESEMNFQGKLDFKVGKHAKITCSDALDLTVTKTLKANLTGDTTISATGKTITINSGTTNITPTTALAIGVGTNSLSIKAGEITGTTTGAMKMGGDTSAEFSSKGETKLLATGQLTVSGTGGVDISSAGIINIGKPNAMIPFTDLVTATQLKTAKDALELDLVAQKKALDLTITAEQALISAQNVVKDAMSKIKTDNPFLSKYVFKI